MKKSGIKHAARAAGFLACLLFLLYLWNTALAVKSDDGINQARYLYAQPKNTIDVLFLGSSHVHCNINTAVLWEEYGIAAYHLTSAEQPLWNSYHYLVEALKTQSPSLVVLDMFSPARFYDDYQPKWLGQNVNGMRLSLNKYQAVKASTPTDVADYVLGFPNYHTRYSRLEEADFRNFFWNKEEMALWKGYTPLDNWAELTEPDFGYVTETKDMTEKSQLYFDKIVELTEREGIRLVLISAPYLLTEEDQKVYNRIAELAEEHGISFVNYNSTEMYREAGIDFSVDYADHTHLNIEGSEKYSRHLGKWLKDNCEIPDRRGEERYRSWEEGSEHVMDHLWLGESPEAAN